jgi:uncharacterized tellurite resistance protein B-like protein
MLEAIRQFVTGRLLGAKDVATGDAAQSNDRRLQLAACALLLELAYADDEFTPDERRHIEQMIGDQFALAEADVAELMRLAEAERSQSLDHFQFTRLIAAEYDLRQKMALAELMWGVILADGRLSDHETHLLRKLASLMQLEPAYLAQARRSATGDS